MQISFINNGVFLIIAIVNSMVCFTLFGVTGSVFGVLTVLFTHIVYAAKPDNKNILYVWFLLVHPCQLQSFQQRRKDLVIVSGNRIG